MNAPPIRTACEADDRGCPVCSKPIDPMEVSSRTLMIDEAGEYRPRDRGIGTMSDRPCNRCDFETRKRKAKKDRKKLKAVSDDGWMKIFEADIGTDNWTEAGVSYRVLPPSCEC